MMVFCLADKFAMKDDEATMLTWSFSDLEGASLDPFSSQISGGDVGQKKIQWPDAFCLRP